PDIVDAGAVGAGIVSEARGNVERRARRTLVRDADELIADLGEIEQPGGMPSAVPVAVVDAQRLLLSHVAAAVWHLLDEPVAAHPRVLRGGLRHGTPFCGAHWLSHWRIVPTDRVRGGWGTERRRTRRPGVQLDLESGISLGRGWRNGRRIEAPRARAV